MNRENRRENKLLNLEGELGRSRSQLTTLRVGGKDTSVVEETIRTIERRIRLIKTATA